jgi:hypothetical protein
LNEYLEEYKAPVPEEIINQLPIIEFTAENQEKFSEENKTCTVCMCNYEVGEQYLMLECLHRYHVPCVKEWFKQKNTCPVCKEPVFTD